MKSSRYAWGSSVTGDGLTVCADHLADDDLKWLRAFPVAPDSHVLLSLAVDGRASRMLAGDFPASSGRFS
jgi:hypothetical protein